MRSEPAGEGQPPWRGQVTDYPDDCSIAELFRRQAARTPDAVAVGEGGRQVTYAELDRWSCRLAARLVAAGVEPGEPVGVLGERCLEAPAAMLGVLRAGAAYVPLDRTDPIGRLRALADELMICRLVTLPGSAGILDRIPTFAVREFRADPPGPPQPPAPAVPCGGGDPAYIMFTSGSTGVPKAVVVPHRAVARLVLGADYLRITAADRLTNTGHLAFDASVFEIWGALLNGARVVVVDPDTLLDPARLAALYRTRGITVAWLSAGVFHQCVRADPGMFAGLRCLIAGGDVLNPELVRRVLAAGPPQLLVNGYGPTENTTFSTTYRIVDLPPGLTRIPIGRPVANSTCHILTRDGRPAPVGVTGELCVGGDGVALGYANSPELTERRFVADPHGRRPGARLFRTGDLARWLPTGDIDFLGRGDRMVKLRDFRIELSEIEAVLASHPAVGEAAAVVAGDDPTTSVIVAFYVPASGSDASPPRLRTYLAERLPHFMLPARLVPRDRLPLTGTGKVDQAALVADATAHPGPATPPARPPVTPVQVGVARLWAEILDVDEVGLDDSFFELGGNSLLAARVFARLQTTFGVGAGQGRFLTSRLLADPSLEASAAAVQEARAGLLGRDKAGLDIDLRREVRLNAPPPAGPGRKVPRQPDRSGADILLTGATGFLGSYLLRELLNRTGATIHCLVRALDEEQARHRLAAEQARHGLGELPPGRVVPVVGDLARPMLGLAEDRFDRYARRLSLILHAGAYVNFTYPYANLAPVTVCGTREVIRLATRHGPVPVHFVSSLAVLAGFGAAGVRSVDEDTPLDHPEHLHMGYTETKWVAEMLFGEAARAGLPVAVHRPYEISGDLVHGAWNLENASCALFRLIVDAGIAPDADIPLDLVPVDVLAAQITHIALTRTAATSTYHLANPSPATLNDLTDLLTRHGYPIRRLPFAEWVARAVAYVCANPEHPFTPFVPLWVDRGARSGLVVKEMYFVSRFPRFSRRNAERALAGFTPAMPPVDARLLEHYIRFFQRVGYFPPPPAVPSRPLGSSRTDAGPGAP